MNEAFFLFFSLIHYYFCDRLYLSRSFFSSILDIIRKGNVLMSTDCCIRNQNILMHRTEHYFGSVWRKKVFDLIPIHLTRGSGTKKFFFRISCAKICTILRIWCWFRICMSRRVGFWSKNMPYCLSSFVHKYIPL